MSTPPFRFQTKNMFRHDGIDWVPFSPDGGPVLGLVALVLGAPLVGVVYLVLEPMTLLAYWVAAALGCCVVFAAAYLVVTRMYTKVRADGAGLFFANERWLWSDVQAVGTDKLRIGDKQIDTVVVTRASGQKMAFSLGLFSKDCVQRLQLAHHHYRQRAVGDDVPVELQKLTSTHEEGLEER